MNNFIRIIRSALAERFPSCVSPIGRRDMARRCRLIEVAPGTYRAGGPNGPLIELIKR